MLAVTGLPEIVGIAAVAGIAIGGAFKIATVVLSKHRNGQCNTAQTTSLPCVEHGERLATIEANSISLNEKVDEVSKDVKEILGRVPKKGQ